MRTGGSLAGARTLDDLASDDASFRHDRTLRLPIATGSVLPASLPALPLSETASDDVDLVLGKTLGEGGMGIVALARQVSLDREVVVKRVRPGAPPRAAEALLREARVAGGLEHPNIVPIHALGLDADGQPAMVMKRIEGTAWSAVIRGGNADLERHLAILGQVCQAVAYAHARGVVHRDLKPDNVMIGPFGEVYVVDWGVAARLEAGATTEAITGTPVYMAPEMVVPGEAIGPFTDVYLLGACLHEVLTGVAPHRAATLEAVFASAETSAPFDYGAAVPAELAAIAQRAMAADPTRRFAAATDLQGALSGYLAQRASLALAAAARRRLDELRALLDQPDAPPGRVDELFTEARFGFRPAQALAGAAAGVSDDLRDLARAMAGWKLAHGDLGGAEALLDGLTDDPLHAELARLRAEHDAAFHLAHSLDGRVNARSRILGMAGTFVFFAVVTVALLATLDNDVERYDHRSAFLVAATTGGLILAGIALARRYLWDTSFNRAVSGAAALSVVAILANRALSWSLDVPVPAMMAIDLLFIAVAIFGTLGWVAPVLRVGALPYAAGAVLIVLFPVWTLTIFGLTGLVGIGTLLAVSGWQWGRGAWAESHTSP
jgi:serine/threonine-protein kinase